MNQAMQDDLDLVNEALVNAGVIAILCDADYRTVTGEPDTSIEDMQELFEQTQVWEVWQQGVTVKDYSEANDE